MVYFLSAPPVYFYSALDTYKSRVKNICEYLFHQPARGGTDLSERFNVLRFCRSSRSYVEVRRKAGPKTNWRSVGGLPSLSRSDVLSPNAGPGTRATGQLRAAIRRWQQACLPQIRHPGSLSRSLGSRSGNTRCSPDRPSCSNGTNVVLVGSGSRTRRDSHRSRAVFVKKHFRAVTFRATERTKRC